MSSKTVLETDSVMAFHDINAVAPVHVIVIPKKHIESIQVLQSEDFILLADIYQAIQTIAKKMPKGYRVVTNVGPEGGQTVDHLHFHILGGRHMTWPPG